MKYRKRTARADLFERDLFLCALIYSTGSDTRPQMIVLMPTGPWD